MRLAVLSDIHGNALALEAVLEDMKRQGTIDRVIVAGDFFAPGPATHLILSLLQQSPHSSYLRGNADRYLLEKTYTTVYSSQGWQGSLRSAFHWTAERLGKSEVRFLEALPFSQVVGDQPWQLLAVHGSPRSDEEGLTPKSLGAIFTELSINSRVQLITCGHTHVPMDEVINGVRVVNTGSVGLPFDGDPRACYALISNLKANHPRDVQVDLRRVSYNIDSAIQQLRHLNHPAADLTAYNLRHGRPMGNTDIYTSGSILSNNSSLLS